MRCAPVRARGRVRGRAGARLRGRARVRGRGRLRLLRTLLAWSSSLGMGRSSSS